MNNNFRSHNFVLDMHSLQKKLTSICISTIDSSLMVTESSKSSQSDVLLLVKLDTSHSGGCGEIGSPDYKNAGFIILNIIHIYFNFYLNLTLAFLTNL